MLECWFEKCPIRSEYLIVDGGKLAGAGAHSYSAGNATCGSDEAAKFKKDLFGIAACGNCALPQDAPATTFPSGKVKAKFTRSRLRITLLKPVIVTMRYCFAWHERKYDRNSAHD
jgi:hypothetical protein